jgi:CheY-like chemotaxis protein
MTKLLFSPSPAGSYRHSVTKFLTATDGADAVAMYAQHRDEIAVVLNDMVMTVMPPFTLSRESILRLRLSRQAV